MKNTLLIFFLLSFASLICQTDKEKTVATVNQNDIEAHIRFLSHDLLKGRGTGTDGLKIAALYLANTLRSYGVKPNPKTETYYQEVPLQVTGPATGVALNINGLEYENNLVMQAATMAFNGDAVYLGHGLKEDYVGKDVKGKLIVVKGGGPEGNDARTAYRLKEEKSGFAQKAGAAGVVELVSVEENIWGYLKHNFNSAKVEPATEKTSAEAGQIAYLWLQDPGGEIARDLGSKRAIKTTLAMEAGAKKTIRSQNVVGLVEGTDPELKDEYIIFSAHYDHVGIGAADATGDTIYNGARDNAVGTTTVLAMAENLSKFPAKRSALFIFFTGEEKGLLGSNYYVEHPVLPLDQMVYVFNSDNAGYNDTTLVSIVGLPRTTEAEHFKKAASAFGLTAIGDPAPEQNLFDRSDNVAFAKKGIPAPTFSLGFTSFDGDVTKYYHQAGDEADTLDFDYLFKFFKTYVLSGRLIANDPETPFWTAGDKYEAVGKKLYNQ